MTSPSKLYRPPHKGYPGFYHLSPDTVRRSPRYAESRRRMLARLPQLPPPDPSERTEYFEKGFPPRITFAEAEKEMQKYEMPESPEMKAAIDEIARKYLKSRQEEFEQRLLYSFD